MPQMTNAGLSFLKCAFASPDFAMDPGQGIPDRYEGKILSRKETCNNSVTFTAGRDTFIAVIPTPGIAYWSCVVDSGTFPEDTTVWTPNYYPGFNTLFPAGAADANVTAFRYASLNSGIYPTSNMMQYGGSITVWRGTVKLTSDRRTQQVGVIPALTTVVTTQRTHAGLGGSQGVPNENFSTSFIDGAYSSCCSDQPEFEFTPVEKTLQYLPESQTAANGGRLDTAGANYIVGIGNMPTTFYRVQSAAGAVNSALVKVWSCVEYQPSPESAYYQFAGMSPAYDPVAMLTYRKLAKELPLAVVCAENAKFWEYIRNILAFGSKVASYAPGPIGQAAKGVNMIGTALVPGW
jgi:hypothetical protein